MPVPLAFPPKLSASTSPVVIDVEAGEHALQTIIEYWKEVEHAVWRAHRRLASPTGKSGDPRSCPRAASRRRAWFPSCNQDNRRDVSHD